MALEFKHTNYTLYFGMAAFMRLFAECNAGVADTENERVRYSTALRTTSKMVLTMLGLPADLDTSALDARLLELAPPVFRAPWDVSSGIAWFLESILAADGISSRAYNRFLYDGGTSPRLCMYRGRYIAMGTVTDDELFADIKAGLYPVMAEGRLMGNEPRMSGVPYINYTVASQCADLIAVFDDPSVYPWQVLAAGATTDPDLYALPWAGKLPAIPDHFARLSFKDPGKVSFYENEAKAKAGRRLVMKPGRYLTRYYPDLSADEVREWASKADMGVTLSYADTSDEIVRVYENGPSSCMSHPADDYASSVHPCAVYESPDLKLAFIEYGDKISARCLVWPDKKIHGRIYGDEIRMRALLEAAGYKLLTKGDYGDLTGARLKLIKDRSHVVAPYIDGEGYAHVEGGYLVIGRSGRNVMRCDNTNGFGGYYEEEDELYVADLDEYRSESWVEQHCYYDDDAEEWNRRATRVVTALGVRGAEHGATYYADDGLSERAFLCALDGNWYNIGLEHVEVATGDTDETTTAPVARLDRLGVIQRPDGNYVSKEYAAILAEREAAPLAEAA